MHSYLQKQNNGAVIPHTLYLLHMLTTKVKLKIISSQKTITSTIFIVHCVLEALSSQRNSFFTLKHFLKTNNFLHNLKLPKKLIFFQQSLLK